jgi:hypothetical protein
LGVFGFRSLNISIFDAQNKLATVAMGVEPVEYCGAGGADVEVAGRAGSDANSDCHGEVFELVQVFIVDLSVRSRFWANSKSVVNPEQNRAPHLHPKAPTDSLTHPSLAPDDKHILGDV